ncbi:hypothetical protein H7J86_26240 [Mycobacterium hackensackense]|uniref:hypothetical protein n=1 Tax=Mycobacterium hackensackense TaxID=228909 RepID=UPI002265DCA1|nr:hypothetical protein [Mycobacterium hackensackense]MCV7255669.1 hypothetical protein [Mycobacterium hackensackense]
MTGRPFAAQARRLCPESDEHHARVWFCETCRLLEMRLTPITTIMRDLLDDDALRITNPFNTTEQPTPMPEPDIIDRIDALVDEQMADGKPLNGYEFGDPDYPRCPHCRRHWHGLRITQRIASMYNLGNFDPEYTVAEDDSPILCEGSEFIGPQRPPIGWANDGKTPIYPQWSTSVGRFTMSIVIDEDAIRRSWQRWAELMRESAAAWESVMRGPVLTFYDDMWNLLGQVETRTTVCPDLGDIPDIDVKFGPENWIHEIQRMPPSLQFPRTIPGYRLASPLQADVNRHWHEFTAPEYPLPESPGYDFSQYADQQPPTAGPARTPYDRNRRTR